MYAGECMKLKVQKSHTFYHVQL